MDEFYLYNQLCVLEDIASQYGEGKKSCRAIRSTAELISSHLYRVAVIGEFKRGKSSLINALVGADILPTDVIPLTAAITRLTYGTERKIIVHYKSGGSEEKTLEQLMDYATKYDAQRAITAETVREIEVKYPSVLCKSHIELLDTPGLNDNESMSQVTLSILGDIDAAIVVISATKPLSMTEQDLVIDLIRQEGIRHLVFVVTFLDTLADEEEKDRMLSFLRGRLQKDLLARASRDLADDSAHVEKARRILSAPDVFGVSSRQARQGFIHDDRALLKESRFPEFKEALLALLTAAQSEDVPKKVECVTDMVGDSLSGWYEFERGLLSAQTEERLADQQAWRRYMDCSRHELSYALKRMDACLQKKGLSETDGIQSAELEKKLCKLFIVPLSALKQQSATHEAIHAALQEGKDQADIQLKNLEQGLRRWVSEAMDGVLAEFRTSRDAAGLPAHVLSDKLDGWQRQQAFPPFSWTQSPIPPRSDLRGMDVIAHVKQAISRSLSDYGKAISKFIASWRVVLLRQNAEDRSTAGMTETLEAAVQSAKMRQSALEFNYLQHVEKIRDIKRSIAAMGFDQTPQDPSRVQTRGGSELCGP